VGGCLSEEKQRSWKEEQKMLTAKLCVFGKTKPAVDEWLVVVWFGVQDL